MSVGKTEASHFLFCQSSAPQHKSNDTSAFSVFQKTVSKDWAPGVELPKIVEPTYTSQKSSPLFSAVLSNINQQYLKKLDESQKLYEKKDYTQALESIRQSIGNFRYYQPYPKIGRDSFLQLGFIHAKTEHLEEAIAAWKMSLYLSEEGSTAAQANLHALIADAYYHQANYDVSLKHYDEALRLFPCSPNHSFWHLRRGKILFMKKDDDAALDSFLTGMNYTLSPPLKFELFTGLAYVYRAKHEHKSAKDALHKAMKLGEHVETEAIERIKNLYSAIETEQAQFNFNQFERVPLYQIHHERPSNDSMEN